MVDDPPTQSIGVRLPGERPEGADDGIPPGWDYNPAAWSQRLPIVGLAVIGVGIATWLSLFQFGVLSTIWEPFFGDGSRQVLESKLSRVLPIPDAALGAFAYFVDAVAGIIGGTKRWRTMPWIVVVFGLAVGPLGAVSIALVMSQPLVVGAWCTLCLASAVISLAMIGPAMDEMLASLQYMKRVKEDGRPFWRHFWGLADSQ